MSIDLRGKRRKSECFEELSYEEKLKMVESVLDDYVLSGMNRKARLDYFSKNKANILLQLNKEKKK